MLGGSWVAISRAIGRVTTLRTLLRVRVALLLITHEPPIRGSEVGFSFSFSGLGSLTRETLKKLLVESFSLEGRRVLGWGFGSSGPRTAEGFLC